MAGISQGSKLLLDVDNNAFPSVRPLPRKLRFRGYSLNLNAQGGKAALPPRFCPSDKTLVRALRRAPSAMGPRAAAHKRGKRNPRQTAGISAKSKNYSSMSITTPEPTVRPPSRMAKRRPFSMAMGVISSTFMSTLSPGMHISVPSGRVMMPVTSVVRK